VDEPGFKDSCNKYTVWCLNETRDNSTGKETNLITSNIILHANHHFKRYTVLKLWLKCGDKGCFDDRKFGDGLMSITERQAAGA